MAIPAVGEIVQIHSYKHNGRIHRVRQETMVLKSTNKVIIGANERTLVTESDGRTWLTLEEVENLPLPVSMQKFLAQYRIERQKM